MDVFLEAGDDQGLYGRQNSMGADSDGLRMAIFPLMEDFGGTILELIRDYQESFPYEYYAVQFSAFSGATHVSYTGGVAGEDGWPHHTGRRRWLTAKE
ncbi:hypothetical protein [Pseudomonas syringae]|uniref:hypothetical protein n=1 Tax=Pseudomonas syringae TaxID=317 RepID=UPI001179B4C1|nr:hypothetical protein [Pseudomonas syringae]